MRTKLSAIIGLELYALLLAAWQLRIGVRTDEAKYLLDIPYPHPPLVRSILSMSDGWQYHEAFWRIVLATLMVQAVWLVLSLVRDRTVQERMGMAALWLLSAALIYQAGTVMMAPLTALQGLVFVWLFVRAKDDTSSAGLIALFWLASLFTAYQAVFFGPLVLGIFLRMRRPVWVAFLLTAVPVALLCLYTLTNPLAAASMFLHAGKDASQTLSMRFTETAWIWALGGSVALSIAGTAGLFARPRWELIGSFLLAAAYVFLSRYDYYAIVFTPLFMAGMVIFMRKKPVILKPVVLLMPFGLVALFLLRPPETGLSFARTVMRALPAPAGDIVINGSFGHEWQYQSDVPVYRYSDNLPQSAGMVICLEDCPGLPAGQAGMTEQTGWSELSGLPVEVWVKR